MTARLGIALGALLIAFAILPVGAQTPDAPRAVVLIHHPFDQVDPFGIAFPAGAETDTFSSRYQHLVSDVGRFDFPYFVADGLASVRAIPDPLQPYESTLQAYTNETEARLALPIAATMSATATLRAQFVDAWIGITPMGPLADPQPQGIHLWLALSEDQIHYQPPAPVSNGVTDHRFTVRSLVDAGVVDLRPGLVVNRTMSLPMPTGWNAGHVVLSTWLQVDGTPGRFQPHEVVQAVQARLDGVTVTQTGKGVLVELYSATWCNPCLYGDMAAESLAVKYAGAEPLKPSGRSYFEAPSSPILVAAIAVVAGLAIAFVPLRRQP